jgi:hypothetical protein
MSVLISDIRIYGSQDMPEADGSTVGGLIDFHKRVEFGTLPTPSSTPPFTATQYDVVSSSASDAGQITFNGRESTGLIPTPEVLTLNGTTKVTSANSYERLLSALTTGASNAFNLTAPSGTGSQAVGDVALMSHTLTVTGTAQTATNATSAAPAVIELQSTQGASVSVGDIIRITNNTPSGVEYQLRRILAINPNSLGADYVAVDRNWTTLPTSSTTYEIAPGMHFELTGSNGGVAITGTSTQVLGITRLFSTTAADIAGGSQRIYYDKVFVNNNNQTTALTSATLEIASDSPVLPGSALLDIGVDPSLNDNLTISARLNNAPVGVTFVTQPGTVNVPGGNLSASLGAGVASGSCGVWLRLTLPAGTTAYEGSPGAQFNTQGSST